MSDPAVHRPDDDEEALRWGSESDQSHTETPLAPSTAAVDTAADPDAPERQQLSSLQLVTFGILAGVYLLYTIGWIFVVTRTPGASPVLLTSIMTQFGQFLAIAAAPLWFFTAFTLTRDRRPVARLTWLLLGVVVLVPLPFVLGV